MPGCNRYITGDAPTVEQPVKPSAPAAEQPAPLISASPPSLSVAPGAHVDCEVRVENTAAMAEDYDLAMIGDAAAWAAVEPAGMSLEPGAVGAAKLTFHPPAAAAGELAFEVRATSKQRPTVTASVSGSLTVAAAPPPPPAPLEMAVAPPEASAQPGLTAEFEARVANRGSAPVRVTLTVAGPAAAYASVEPVQLDLAPGATGAAGVTVTVPAATTPGRIPLTLNATPVGDPAAAVAAQGTLVVKPVSRGRWIAVAGVMAALVVLAVVVVVVGVGDDRGDPPPDGNGGRRGPDTGDGISGTVATMTDPLRVRDPESGEQVGLLDKGSPVKVICQAQGNVVPGRGTGPWLKLKEPSQFEGKWVFSPPVQLDGTPPDC